ncbi:MAG: hypothetical protein GH151_14570 [Bacteroidetes bacterium]|nr:hypothetical protein [Bacteroidota bacterium]
MTKKKKGKVIQLPLTPEKYIRTRARQLPVYECYITKRWKESGMANIIIARKHTNNNFTFGLYLVDLLCLGVKDTYYDFNVTNVDYEDLKNEYFGKQDIVKCDYVLAHNIIYGAVEFADEYGFKPHKDFAVSKYILEEDDENVELMEIEFGEDEKPCVVVTNGNEQKQIIAQLDKTAGKGNYTVIYLDDDYPGDDFDEVMDNDDLNDWTDEDWKDFFDEEKDLSGENRFKVTDYLYEYHFGKEESSNHFIPEEPSVIEDQITFEPIDEHDYYTSKKDKKKTEKMYYMTSEAPKKAIPVLKDLVKQYPDNPVYYNYLANAYLKAGYIPASEKIVITSYKKFPGYLFAKCNYADYLLIKERIDEIPEVFDHKFELKHHLPGREKFHIGEVIGLYSVLCRYFTARDEIHIADYYYKILRKFSYMEYPVANQALYFLQRKKFDKVLAKLVTEAENLSYGKQENTYEGLNPHDFFQIILNTLGEGSPIILQSSIANIDLDRSPLFRLAEVYLGEIIKYQPLKLTINGNLPRNLCRELYEIKIIKDDYQEVGVPKIASEKDFMYLHNIRLLCDMAGLTKKRHNRISLTKKGEKLVDNSKRTQLFHLILKTYTVDFNWAYNDLYEDDGTLQSGFGYTLYLVKKFGKTEKETSFYSEKYLKAFPFLIDQFDEGIWYKNEDYFRDCYILRTFSRFLEPFGFVEIRREGANVFKDKDYIKKTKLFDKVFSFSVNSSDDYSSSDE